jgi:hypothetical protein
MIDPQNENARGERAFSVVDLGVVGVFYISTRRLWGAVKEPREFRKFIQRTIEASELLIAIGLPALMTRAVWA